jgi:nitrate reductase gamma subunit
MQRPSPHFSRPVYEGLPWVYIMFGLGALLTSYLLAAHAVFSLLMGLLGLVCVVGGFVLLLRRRDYRALRSQYADPDSLGGNEDS